MEVQTHVKQIPKITYRGEASNLVAKALGRDDGNILSDLLVGLEIMSQTGVVLLDENTCCLLDGLGANATLHRHMYEKSLEHQERPLQGGCKTGVCRGCNITPLHKLDNQILRFCYSHHLFSHEMHGGAKAPWLPHAQLQDFPGSCAQIVRLKPLQHTSARKRVASGELHLTSEDWHHAKTSKLI